jgi:hypothetical protein
VPISIGRKPDAEAIDIRGPYNKNRKNSSKRKSGLNSDVRNSNNFDVIESYGAIG